MRSHLRAHWKHAVSCLMTVVMMVGMLPTTAFALSESNHQAEAVSTPAGSFELTPAGTTAWNGGEEPMIVYSSQTGTAQEAEITAGESFALLEDSGGDRLTIGYSEGGWTGSTL